jgi:ribosome biogenesis GTPase
MRKDSDLFLDYEEKFHKDDKREFKEERKRAIDKDRSKYKKTDQSQKKKQEALEPAAQESGMQGRVLGIYPEALHVDVDGTIYLCQLKGSLKKDKSNKKNLVTIGDFVLFEIKDQTCGTIFRILPRRSVLSRADNLLRRKEQLIAANIDQVLITTSIHYPVLKPFLIDRYIIAAEKGNMQPIIVINKVDLLEESLEEELLAELEDVYKKLSIPFLRVSANTGQGIDELKAVMAGKASVFSGQSGTGKSSLINAVTGANLKTGQIVDKTVKGSHTTTSATLLPLEGGGFCIDTPGIKSFGLWDLTPAEIEPYFTEIGTKALECKFSGCSHGNEPGCAVQEALEKGEISPIRFESYCSLIETLKKEHKTR